MKKLHYPKPKKLYEELELDNVNKHRKFDCIFYEFCLDHAVDFLYESFSCTNCTYYYKTTTSIKEYNGFNEMAKEILKDKSNGST
jgi:hypothetical protein